MRHLLRILIGFGLAAVVGCIIIAFAQLLEVPVPVIILLIVGIAGITGIAWVIGDTVLDR